MRGGSAIDTSRQMRIVAAVEIQRGELQLPTLNQLPTDRATLRTFTDPVMGRERLVADGAEGVGLNRFDHQGGPFPEGSRHHHVEGETQRFGLHARQAADPQGDRADAAGVMLPGPLESEITDRFHQAQFMQGSGPAR